MILESLENELTKIYFADKNIKHDSSCRVLEICAKQLDQYFNMKRKVFFHINFNVTSFQKKVYQILLQIPYGKTGIYESVAVKLRNKNLAQAVGNALKRNSLILVLLCHRLINKNGKIGGFSGEVWRKEWLLKFEGAI
jgi:methylated-DNA-[protein]-cysteine S-methyltransferase